MDIKLDFSILNSENVPESNVEPQKLYHKLAAEAKQLEVYAAYQTAIIKSGQLTSEITKGIQAEENPELLLLKAVKCISLMTGNRS